MSQRKKNLSLSRIPKTRSQIQNSTDNQKRKKNNRRTSLDVNLSYTSESSSILQNENETKKNKENDENHFDDISKNIKLNISKNKIKPSSVILNRITIPNKYGDLVARDKTIESRLTTSQRERSFSKESTIILESTMDFTDVQGSSINSTDDFIPDTECTEIFIPTRLTTVIPDSQPDADVDMDRTSMNVNTSLDSSVLNPERSLAERGFLRNVFVPESDEISQSSSVSSFGNIPMNSTIVTRAVIERNDSPGGKDRSINLPTDKEKLYNNEVNKCSNENRRENEPSVIDERISVTGSICSSDKVSKNLSSSSSSSSSPSLSSSRKKLGDIYQRIIFSGISKSRDLDKKGKNNNKKKLMRLRLSGMVDLSPVTVKKVRPTVKEPFLLGGRFKKRNNKRTKKKVPIKIVKRKLRIGGSDDDNNDNDNDDDDENIDEVLTEPKKDKRLKKIKAKKIIIKKFADVEIRKRMNENSRNIINELSDDELYTSDCEESNENSLKDFEPKINLTKRKNLLNNKIKFFIVATGLSVEDRKLIKSTVTSLGSARMQNIVSRRTTHVISKGMRTVNYLRGIIRGCWIVSLNWISKSREVGKWLDAESYEMKKLSDAIEKNRKERQLLKSAYISELFLTCGSIHINDETSIPVSVLEELIRLGGGQVSPKSDKAKIIIGSKGLKEGWILDSITQGELQPFEGYHKKKESLKN